MDIKITIPESQRSLIEVGITFNPNGQETLEECIQLEFIKLVESWQTSGRQGLINKKFEEMKVEVEKDIPVIEPIAMAAVAADIKI